MFTQCPECGQIQALSINKLRNTRGTVRCSKCSAQFDAVRHLNETPTDHSSVQSSSLTDLPWMSNTPPDFGHWGLIFLLGLFLLLGQITYFELDRAFQNENLRPMLKSFCTTIGCRVPDYRNTDDFAVLYSALTPMGGKHYHFRATINNQAIFPQPSPKLKLSFLKINGEIFAQRIFQPDRYMVEAQTQIKPDQTFEIALDVLLNEKSIGGYIFELI